METAIPEADPANELSIVEWRALKNASHCSLISIIRLRAHLQTLSSQSMTIEGSRSNRTVQNTKTIEGRVVVSVVIRSTWTFFNTKHRRIISKESSRTVGGAKTSISIQERRNLNRTSLNASESKRIPNGIIGAIDDRNA